MANDASLLAAWRAGDAAAGDVLVERYFGAVCRFFRSKLGDDVEDLIQRTFLDCVEARDTITAPSFRSYLFAVARNRLFDHLRRELRQPVDRLGDTSIADMRTLQSGRLIGAQNRDLVIQAMQGLPLDFQVALELAYWEGLRAPEIASVLGISEHTVRSRSSRARQMLRARVSAVTGDGARASDSSSGHGAAGPKPHKLK